MDNRNSQILKYFTNAESTTRDSREQSLEDRKFCFVAGGMWGDKFFQDWKNGPMIEINKVLLSIIRIIGEHLSNQITVDFHNKFGEKNDIASVLDGKFRATEQDSNAEEAYSNMFLEGSSGGFGSLRLVTCYNDDEYEEDEEDEDEDKPEQEIRIEPIYDADCSVYFDAHSKKQDKSDSRHVFCVYEMSRDDFEAEYGTEKMSNFEVYKPYTGAFDWVTGDQNDIVKVSEYYEKEKVKIEYEIYENQLSTIFEGEPETKQVMLDDDDYDEIVSDLKLKGWIKKGKTKSKKITKIRKYIVSGCGIIEDCGYIAGKYLPIIPYYGMRFFVGGKEHYQGHVRHVKDASVVYNATISSLVGNVATESKELPIFHVDQVPPQIAEMWADRVRKNYPYLLVDSIKNANGQNNVVSGPLGYTKPADLPPTVAALIQQINSDISDLLGNQENGDKIVSNISAEAIESVQERLEKQAFIYINNFSKALRHLGRVWLSMAKDIYVEDNREIKTIDISGDASKAILNEIGVNGEMKNDISKADLDVVVSVGAKSSTKAEKNSKKLLALLPYIQDPDSSQNITDLLIMNMDFEGQSDIKKYYRKRLVSKGVLEPTEEEKISMEEQARKQQQPDPNAMYLMASAKKAEADAQKTIAEIDLTRAKVDNEKADTLKILQETGQSITQFQEVSQKQQFDNINTLQTQRNGAL